MGRKNLTVYDNYHVPIEIAKSDFDFIQNIASKLYFEFEHKILKQRSGNELYCIH